MHLKLAKKEDLTIFLFIFRKMTVTYVQFLYV